LPRRKIGVALSSGAAGGFAHIGALLALEKEGIPIDMIAGTSSGAFIGALYAQSMDANEVKDMIIELGKKRVSYTLQLLFAKTRLIRAKKARNWLSDLIGGAEFTDLKIPFACVATDVWTGEEVVIKEGLVMDGVRASGSYPIILPMFKWDGRYVIDGGVVNPVPVSVLREMGANFIIAVNVIPDRSKRLKPMGKKPSTLTLIQQLFHIGRYQTVKASLVGADIVIAPQVKHIGFGGFHRAAESIALGEVAAQESMPELKRLLDAQNV